MIPAIIGAIGAIAGAGINAHVQEGQNAENRQYNREYLQQQRKWALEDREYYEKYNDPKNALKRLQDAGINPMAMGSEIGTGESAMPTNPNFAPPEGIVGANFQQTASDVMQGFLGVQQMELNKKKTDAETKKLAAETSLTNIQQGLATKSKEELESKIQILNQQLADLKFEFELKKRYRNSEYKNIVDSLYYDVQQKRTNSHLLNIFGFYDYVANLTNILASAENTVENTRLASKYAWSAVENALANMKNAKVNEKLSHIPMTEHLIKMEPFATKYVDDDGHVTYHNWMNEYEFERAFRVGMKQKAFKGSALQNDYLQKNVDWYSYNQILNGINTGVGAATSIYGMRNPVQNPLNMGNTQDTWYDYDKKGKVQHVQRTTRNSYRGR